LTACATVILLLAGALVTSTGSSLAVPDWPLSFGTLFPEMTGGVFYEHGHRLVAGSVGLMTLGVVLLAQWVEKRSRVRGLAWWALGAVVFQALLGGLTVLLKLPPQISVAHAGLAQVFFCLIVSLALVTSRSWTERKSGPIPRGEGPSPRTLLGVTVLVYLQIVVGAVTRHLGGGLAIPDFPLVQGGPFPAEWTPLVTLNFLHTRVGSLLVLLGVSLAAYRTCVAHAGTSGLFWPAACAGFLVWAQCFLGLSILLTHKAVVPTSVHLVTGAGLLASMVVLTLNSFRMTRRSS
jgi:cytochrome c oxidase assembly protein subunit 15